jgi:pimeloyl-ACP methyl ester carboxylesterase
MAKHAVLVTGRCPVPADTAWAIARQFTAAWHPALDTITAERGATGGLVRCFTVKGDKAVYREQLTYISDSDCCMIYRHLEGISGVHRYSAKLQIHAGRVDSCDIAWSAEFDADDPRGEEIAQGTRAIFEHGIAAIATATPPNTTARHEPAAATPTSLQLTGPPALGLDMAGAPSGTLCLFLHGIGGRRQNWRAQLPVAARHLQAAALDLRGYGGSALGPTPSDVEAYCADILSVMTHFAARKLVLVGLSYGSWIATSFAMRYPDKLAGLVLSGGCTGMSEASDQVRDGFRASREGPLDQGKTPADFAPDVLRVIAGPHANTAVREELFASMAAIPAATYRDAVRCFTQPTERFDFSRLALPVLMITGEHDKLASPDEIRSVAQRIHAGVAMPNVRFEVIPGAGHVCNVEAPDAYNRILAQFLRGIAP